MVASSGPVQLPLAGWLGWCGCTTFAADKSTSEKRTCNHYTVIIVFINAYIAYTACCSCYSAVQRWYCSPAATKIFSMRAVFSCCAPALALREFAQQPRSVCAIYVPGTYIISTDFASFVNHACARARTHAYMMRMLRACAHAFALATIGPRAKCISLRRAARSSMVGERCACACCMHCTVLVECRVLAGLWLLLWQGVSRLISKHACKCCGCRCCGCCCCCD